MGEHIKATHRHDMSGNMNERKKCVGRHEKKKINECHLHSR